MQLKGEQSMFITDAIAAVREMLRKNNDSKDTFHASLSTREVLAIETVLNHSEKCPLLTAEATSKDYLLVPPRRNGTESEHAFCRELLKTTMREVRKAFTGEQINAAWAWDSGGRKQYEFHGPNKEYVYNLDADCLWSAKASGWNKLLAQSGRRTLETQLS